MSEKTPLHIRDHRGPGWFFIDKDFITEYGKELGAYGIAVYNILAMHANNTTQESYPSYNTIAALMGCSRVKVIHVIEQLEGYKIIEKTKRQGADGVYMSNVITLLHKDVWIPVNEDSDERLLRDIVNEVNHPLVNEVNHPPSTPDLPVVNDVAQGGKLGEPKLDSVNYTESDI